MHHSTSLIVYRCLPLFTIVRRCDVGSCFSNGFDNLLGFHFNSLLGVLYTRRFCSISVLFLKTKQSVLPGGITEPSLRSSSSVHILSKSGAVRVRVSRTPTDLCNSFAALSVVMIVFLFECNISQCAVVNQRTL